MSNNWIGIIGGSGLYEMEGLSEQEWRTVETPFGAPSDQILTGKLEGRSIAFLPRHARGHRLLPSELNHRANIFALKKLGVEWILSVGAVGSLQAEFKPCDVVLPDQFIDHLRTTRNQTLFGNGIVAHVAFAEPVCMELNQIIYEVTRSLGARVHQGGTYVNMEGPAFSTRAESIRNHKAGYSVIGMTNMGEARCAREAEIAYATIAMVSDYDSWNLNEEHVTSEMVMENFSKNIALAKRILKNTISRIPLEPNWPCHSSLKNAIFTPRDYWPREWVEKLKPILDKYL
ncbi:MAG: S-methyl-5'-thioadenosine phosphorylase [Limisphaerales bacterium]|nr:S-methyl-5'-thioadenosine phosphorylase [Verrucomicrobiota bacterium]